MAIKVKPVADVVKKFIDVTPTRSAYYESGATAAGADWEKNTLAASKNFKAGVSAGNIEQMFAGGVKKAGAEKFTRKVKDVGAQRFGSGVQASAQDYANGIAPMLEEIARIDLPARAPRGSDSNIERVRKIATALTKKRLALRAAGQ